MLWKGFYVPLAGLMVTLSNDDFLEMNLGGRNDVFVKCGEKWRKMDVQKQFSKSLGSENFNLKLNL